MGGAVLFCGVNYDGWCNGLSVMSGCMGGVCWWVWMLDLSREGRCK